ncbi:unnamed protein product [Cylindrotheca closterium]|uniref:DNA-directed RNA polymerase n=1 Tax=Cylindrotheca closterium TaxID=2856 RepID=A0AAD2CEW1_9STRA|nr:unnamed protein product [Cylindrotheca closterium]
MTKQKVSVRVEDTNAVDEPVVVSFPSGLPESIHSGGSDNVAPKFSWQKKYEKLSSSRKIVGKDKHCIYTASAKGSLFDDRRTKLCVGVYDKKKGVLVLKQAATKGTVFALEQTVPSYLEHNKVIKTRTIEDVLSYGTNVYEDFGSSKKRKVLRSQAANRVEIDHVFGAGQGSAVVDKVMKGEAMSESNRKAVEASKKGDKDHNLAQEIAFETLRRNFLPPYNELAVKPNKVYEAKEIAGETAWSKIYNTVHYCTHQADVTSAIEECLGDKEKAWHDCTLKLVREITPDSNNAGHRYACTILLNHLINFFIANNRRKSIAPIDEKSSSHFGIPNEVASKFLELFTTEMQNKSGKFSYAMSKTDKDKCIVHALVLYMIAHGPSMKIGNVKKIADDMKVPLNDCGNMLRLAGCTVAKKGPIMSAILKTPLTFPPPKRGGPRGR